MNDIPLKAGNKTYKNFASLKASLKKQGKSEESATKITAEIMHRQENPGRSKSKKKK